MDNEWDPIPIDPKLVRQDAAVFEDDIELVLTQADDMINAQEDQMVPEEFDEMPALDVGESKWMSEDASASNSTLLGHQDVGRWGDPLVPVQTSSAWVHSAGRRRIDCSKVEILDLTRESSAPLSSRHLYNNYEEAGEKEPTTTTATSRTLTRKARRDSTMGESAIESGSDTDVEIIQPRSHVQSNDKPSASTSTAMAEQPQQPSLAQELRDDDEIPFPQVIGKRAFENPRLIDPFVANEELKLRLEMGTHPDDVLWAAFLKNNTFYFDTSSACDNMQIWLHSTPHRYKHITSLVFEDVFWHPHIRQQVAAPNRKSVYRPIKLIAKCSNLNKLELRVYLHNLRGYQQSFWKPPTLDVDTMSKVFEEKGIHELMHRLPRTVRDMKLCIYADELVTKRYRQGLTQIQDDLTQHFCDMAEASDWKSAEWKKLNFRIMWLSTGN